MPSLSKHASAGPPGSALAIIRAARYEAGTMFETVLVFCLGVINFAAHKAVLESGHPLLAHAPWLFQLLGGRLSLLVEFAMLLGALVMAAAGSAGWAWVYLLYTALNGFSAWLIFSGRL